MVLVTIQLQCEVIIVCSRYFQMQLELTGLFAGNSVRYAHCENSQIIRECPWRIPLSILISLNIIRRPRPSATFPKTPDTDIRVVSLLAY